MSNEFVPSMSRNPYLMTAMTDFATNLITSELLPSIAEKNGADTYTAALRLKFEQQANTAADKVIDDAIEDMVSDAFYAMLDEMRDTMKEYRPYIIDAFKEDDNE